MRVRFVLINIATFLLISVPVFSQGVGNKCDVSGTWYGGSADQLQYLWTISPLGAGRYQSTIQAGFNPPTAPIRFTNWSGEIKQIKSRSYESQEMSYWVLDPDPSSLPQVQIVHTNIELTDCNTLVSTIDLWAGYSSFTREMTPFVDDTDIPLLLIVNGGNPIVETYRRLPTPDK